MGGAVIELDLAEPWDPEPAPARRRPLRLPSWLLPAVVTVATLLAVTSAVAPRRWDPVLTLREANTNLQLGPDDTAFVVTQRTRSGRLQAFPPGRDRPLWTVNFPGGFPMPQFVDDDPGLLMVPVYDADPAGRGSGNQMQARDAHTGRLLWSRPGMSLLGFGAEVAVVTNRSQTAGQIRIDPGTGAVLTDGVAGPAPVVEAVDRRTGTSRWTRAVPPDALVSWSKGDVVVEVAPDGRLRRTDAATGVARGETRLTLLGRPFHAYVDGDLAVVYQQLPGGDPSSGQIAVGYDLGSGEERWKEDAQRFDDCAARYRCEVEPGHVTVTDAASGTVRYSGPGDRYVLRGDRLIVTATPDRSGPPGTRIYDLRTGRLLHALPAWTFAGPAVGPGLMVQPLAGSGLLVAAFDDVTGRLTVLGRATDWTGGAYCVRGTRHVGCSGTSGVRMWRLPA